MASRVDWAAVIAGTVLTTASALILLAFGGAIGLSVASPYEGSGLTPALFAIAAGLWMLWVHVLSFSIGGYVSTRLRARHADESEHEADVRDGMHGLLVWGAGVVVAAMIAFFGIGGGATAARTADNRQDIVASAGAVAAERIDEAAAAEARENPDAAGASQAEREAEITRKLTIISAFITAASLLAGAVAAFWAAGEGGNHRDKNVHVRFFVLRPPRTTATTVKP
jgi:hypothetical protein